jgi:cytochrome c oxidase cbb3-type subunit I/II
MPSFADSMTEPERWAISYYVLSLSAWMDPLTGKPLEVSPQTRARLNGREIEADHPRLAVDPSEPTRTAQPGRRLYPGIRE